MIHFVFFLLSLVQCEETMTSACTSIANYHRTGNGLRARGVPRPLPVNRSVLANTGSKSQYGPLLHTVYVCVSTSF